MSAQFPEPYTHDHPPVRNVNELARANLTWGEWAADRIATVVGSWPFVLCQTGFLLVWAALNVVGWVEHWDPYPFILMNLFLSLQAAYTAPMIMMSQNRVAELDRARAENDYEINVKAEEEVRVVLAHLEAQSRLLLDLQREVRTLRAQLDKPTSAGP